MTTLGIFIVIILSLIALLLIGQVTYEFIWNKRLRAFQKNHNIKTFSRKMIISPVRRSLIAVTSLLMVLVFAVTGIFDLPEIYKDKTLVNAQTAGNYATLKAKIEAQNGFDFNWFNSNGFFGTDDARVEEDVGSPTPDSSNDPRDVVGTNLQTKGVDEADIIKTDGFDVFYTPSYRKNSIYKFSVDANGAISQTNRLEITDGMVENFYLTETKLVVIGYEIEQIMQYYRSDVDALFFNFYYYNTYKSRITIYNRETFELEYTLLTNGYIRDHRLIDDMLYLVTYNYINLDELRPRFDITVGNVSSTEYVNYNQIIMFNDVPATQMFTVSTLNIKTHDLNHESAIGPAGIVYMTKESIYITGYYYYNRLFAESTAGTHLIKFNVSPTNGSVKYAGSTKLKGTVGDQFWLDEYEGNLRIVTSRSWGATDKNHLYILKENNETDQLDIIGHLDKGIGKPDERVMSARFDKDIAYVVTFRNTDPLYTIDVSNPNDIKILNEIEEPGYNTYLHVWDDFHLVGIGYDSSWNVKLSVYHTLNTVAPLETYQFSLNTDGGYEWNYAEALRNHKAILVSPEHGFIGFSLNRSHYDYELGYYTYNSFFYLFYLDFNNEKVIGDPYIMDHGAAYYDNKVDRGIYIDNIFYTFSTNAVVTFNGLTKEIGDRIELSHPTID